MPRGFFPSSKLKSTKAPASLIPKCGACRLFEDCKSKKMPPKGKGKRSILIVGEAPGTDEDDEGRHFVGRPGRYLSETLRRYGIDMRRDCILTNAIICRPKDNETPTAAQIEYCRPNVLRAIQEHQPEIVIPLGTSAIQAIFPHIYKDAPGSVMLWSGWRIPSQKINAWVCPTFHPSYVIREESNRNPVPELMFRRHIQKISEIEGQPWKKIPDYERHIERIFDPAKAAKILKEFLASGQEIAFDYESTTLKPESDGAAILTCSVCCGGERTIAYPWLGKAIDATYDLLRSPCGKIAQNLKHEERWSRWYFGQGVRNWVWDTMQTQHCIDNRPGITGLKVQTFLYLGMEIYDDHIKEFLRAKKGTAINRIKEIDLDQLLLYNGLDSFTEYKIAKIQRKIISRGELL